MPSVVATMPGALAIASDMVVRFWSSSACLVTTVTDCGTSFSESAPRAMLAAPLA